MEKKLPFFKIVSAFAQFVLSIYWLRGYLVNTVSEYYIYVFCGILAITGVVVNLKKRTFHKKLDKWVIYILAALFSLIVVLANYNLFLGLKAALLTFISGCIVGYNIFSLFYHVFYQKYFSESHNASKPFIVFIISTLIISAIDLAYLFLCEYPGNVSVDNLFQLGQIEINFYTNHHPYWHTMIIKPLITLGFKLFGTANAAIATYCAFQAVCMAMSFSYVIVTLYQKKIAYKWILLTFLWYALMPYHISFSITMWKDVLFGAVVLLFIVSLFRIFYNVGKNSYLNYGIFILSGIGFGVLRGNGIIALALTLIAMFLFFRSSHTKLCLLLTTITIISYIMTGPVLNHLGVHPTGIQESLSIPCQQVARVIYDGEPITDEQREKINRLIEIERIPMLYASYVSDPIKFNIDSDYLAEHKGEYLMLWIDLGLDHPWSYIKAWVDQTRGYWNGGYQYWITANFVYDNTYGIYKTIPNEGLKATMTNLMATFEYNSNWCLFRGIGLHVWLTFILGIFNFLRGDYKKAFLTLPTLFIVCTLLIATPVFSEFRYAYTVFTCIPFLTLMTFCKENNV